MKYTSSSTVPTFTRLGKENSSVLNSVSRPLLVRTSRKTRATRTMRSSVASCPRSTTMPTNDPTTRMKSKRFHPTLLYCRGPKAKIFSAASMAKRMEKTRLIPASASAKGCDWSAWRVARTIELTRMRLMMNNSNSFDDATLNILLRKRCLAGGLRMRRCGAVPSIIFIVSTHICCSSVSSAEPCDSSFILLKLSMTTPVKISSMKKAHTTLMQMKYRAAAGL
mmetsp:Transcript_15757/g.54713  ORF Transcript_15757/g.54713 Transcript_15757/m.54713 type:complete len:223 (+) Transcript_15757:938-1606(+)